MTEAEVKNRIATTAEEEAEHEDGGQDVILKVLNIISNFVGWRSRSVPRSSL